MIEETFGPAIATGHFAAGAVVLAGVAVHVVSAADAGPHLEHPAVAVALVAVCLLLGPILFIVQLLRSGASTVRVTAAGLQRQGVVLDWPSILSVELRDGLLRSLSRATVMDSMRETVEGFVGRMFFRVAVALTAVGLLVTFCATVISLLTPWHRRVLLHLENGDVVVLHNPKDAERLVRTIGGCISGPTAMRRA